MKPQQSFGSKAFKGAMIGGAVAIGAPVLVAIYEAIESGDSGGANIGLGLLLLGWPVYLALAITLGWLVGWSLERADKS